MIYGIGVSYFMIDQIYNQLVQLYYLPPADIGDIKPLMTPGLLTLAFIFGRFIDALSDPIVGYMSDNSKSKYGKRSFYMMIGGIPLALMTMLFFFSPKSSQMATFWWAVVINGLFFLAYTLVGGPYNALIPDLSKTKEDRLSLSTAQSLFRLIFTALAMILPGWLIVALGNGDTELGIRLTVFIFAMLGIIGVYICVFFLNEKNIVNENTKREKISMKESIKQVLEKETMIYFIAFFFFFSAFNILRGVVNYYVVSIMGLTLKTGTVMSAILFGAAALAFPITHSLAKKYSYKKLLIIDIMILIFASICLLFVNSDNRGLAYPLFALCGLGLSGAAFIFPLAMISELAVSISEKKNISVEGTLFGIQGVFLKLAFLTQQIIQTNLIVLGSPELGDGLKEATSQGVYATMLAAIVMFIISVVLYSMKKD